MTTTSQPYHWLKRVSRDLLQKDSIPLIGSPPVFPWESFSSALSNNLQLEELTIKPAPAFEWRSDKEIVNGLGDRISPLTVSIAPTGGTLSWLMAEEDLSVLMSLLLFKSQPSPQTAVDEETRQGFFQFLALEVINLIPQLNFDKNLSGHILHKTELPTEPSLCLDVSISIKDRAFWGRIVISPDLHQKWKERYALRSVEAPLSRDLELIVRLKAGHVLMTLNEWSKVNLGDFIILDSCSIQPNGEGKISLVVEDTPVFQGKIKDGNIKILESPLYREVGIEMDNNLPDSNANGEEENEEYSYGEDQEEELLDDESQNNENSSEDADDEELEGEGSEEEGILDDDYFEEDFEEEAQEKWPPPPEKRPEDTPKPVTAEAPKVETKKPLSPEEIPLNVVVEVGRLQMSVQQLMELQSGNMLDLNVHPENGVDLVVNGNRIAKGELLLIGDTLGVRIIDMS